jgi:ABC-type phosphate/phosphonate transport system permease subunit
MIKDTFAMAVVGVVMTIAVPFVFAIACLWQLWEIVRHERQIAR